MNGRILIIAQCIADWYSLSARNKPSDQDLESMASTFENNGLSKITDTNRIKQAMSRAYHSATTVLPNFRDVMREMKLSSSGGSKTEKTGCSYIGYDEEYKPGYFRHIYPDADPRAAQNAHEHNDFTFFQGVPACEYPKGKFHNAIGLDEYMIFNKEAGDYYHRG